MENCDTIVRGDRVGWHFKKMSKLEILDEAKKYYEKKVHPKFFQNPFLGCPWVAWLGKRT